MASTQVHDRFMRQAGSDNSSYLTLVFKIV